MTYDQVLLTMVDEESLSFIIKKNVHVDSQLREFVACILEVMTKFSFKVSVEVPIKEWVELANEHIKLASTKRKDQKLRMIFNKIVKMLIVRSSTNEKGREPKAQKLSAFA